MQIKLALIKNISALTDNKSQQPVLFNYVLHYTKLRWFKYSAITFNGTMASEFV